jgi:putative FmdB family regulatory protein
VPIFEFECLQCKGQFELLVRSNTAAACPSCGSADLRKLLSMFAVDSEATRASALKAGRARATKEQRDKAIADREWEDHHHH